MCGHSYHVMLLTLLNVVNEASYCKKVKLKNNPKAC